MIFLLAGVVVVGLLWVLGKSYAEANASHIALFLRRAGGWAVIAFAVFLGMRGRLDLAFLVGGAGWWLAQGHRLDAYLNRRFSIGRKNAQEDAHARSINSPGVGSMSEQEALEVLGLQASATRAQIRDAHRSLMKKLHPDHGGTNYLATRVNLAKDVLLNGHR